MDVVDIVPNIGVAVDISIIPGAILPKVKLVSDFPQIVGLFAHKKQPGLFGNRLLYSTEIAVHFEFRTRRPNQQVDMIGHNDVSPKMNRVFATTQLNRIDHPLASAVLREVWLSVIAGEGERTSFAPAIKVFDLLSVGSLHTFKPSHNGWRANCSA